MDNADRRVMQAMLTCVDEGTKNITDALEQTGMWNDTLLIWSSDNGGRELVSVVKTKRFREFPGMAAIN